MATITHFDKRVNFPFDFSRDDLTQRDGRSGLGAPPRSRCSDGNERHRYRASSAIALMQLVHGHRGQDYEALDHLLPKR